MIKYPYTDFHEMNLDWILNEIKELKAIEESIGNLEELKTQIKDNLVNAINEIVDRLALIASDIDAINTKANEADARSLLNAEHIGRIDDLVYDYNNLVDAVNRAFNDNTAQDTLISNMSNVLQNVLGRLNTLNNLIGNITILKTNDKTSTVNAINELYDSLQVLKTDLESVEQTANNADERSAINSNNITLLNNLLESVSQTANGANARSLENERRINTLLIDLDNTIGNFEDLRYPYANVVDGINKMSDFEKDFVLTFNISNEQTIPSVTADVANSDIPSWDVVLPDIMANKYVLRGIIGFEAKNGNARVNIVPITMFSMDNGTKIRMRFMACGQYSQTVTNIDGKAIMSLRA